MPAAKHQHRQTAAEHEAWAAYRESLRDLGGRDYEEAERAAWARLQEALGHLPRADPSAPNG